MQSLLELMLPSVRTWIQMTFRAPIALSDVQIHNNAGLYAYLCHREQSPFGESSSFASLELCGMKWDILYVGETDKLRDRHLQHLDQIGTCKDHELVRLLRSALQSNAGATVLDCDLDSPLFVREVRKREQGTKPGYRYTRRDLQNSIGWSLVEFFTWIPFDNDLRTRVRTEEALIATLLPPLNRLRRY